MQTLAKIFGKSESVKGMSEPIKIIAAATNSSAEEIDTDLLIAALTELQVLLHTLIQVTDHVSFSCGASSSSHTLLTVCVELITQ